MKINLNWLNDFLPGPLAVQQAADALTMGGLPVESIETHGPDTIIDVEVTSNRGDCLSHVGVARELSALLARELMPAKPPVIQRAAASPVPAFAVAIDAPALCPHYAARIIRGVKVGPSPQWMQDRLASVGVRPISNVVDITNYVMFELGQPLHAFDLAKLQGGRIVVRTAVPGEKIVSIDGRERILEPWMLTIADGHRPVALAGVMGGLDTEVSAATVDVLLESARFDPLSIRKTARALAMKSDSSYRFERGIDPLLPVAASLRAAQLLCDLAGGSVAGEIIQAGATGFMPWQLSLRLARLKQVLGIELPIDEVLAAFARLGLAPRLDGEVIQTTVPSHRLDITQEIDLVEEAARLLGYDRIPMRSEISIRATPPQPESLTLSTISQTLVAGGYFQAITFSFASDALAGDFIPAGEGGKPAALLRAEMAVRKADASLRPSLLPGLLESVRWNESAGTNGTKLFEIGATFLADGKGGPDERRKVALVGSPDYREVRGMVETLLHKLDANRHVEILPAARCGFAAGACGKVVWGGTDVGYLGRIDRAIAQKVSLRELPAVAELELAPLLAGARHVPQLRPLPRFPAVRRDLSLVVADTVSYQAIAKVVTDLVLPTLEEMEYVATYRGKPLAAGGKSVTFTLVFRLPGGTLTSEQVETSVQRVVVAAQEKLQAALRT